MKRTAVPLLGNPRAGFMAERFGLGRSIAIGGGPRASRPKFWRYTPEENDDSTARQPAR